MKRLEALTSIAVWRESPFHRFTGKLQPEGECVVWSGSLAQNGYGKFWSGPGGEASYAHRWIWEYANGPIPPKMTLDHLCRNRACVRVDHLELVTRGENVLRGISTAAQRARQTHCKNGHPLSGHNLLVNRATGHRACRICQNRGAMARYHRRKGTP